MLNYNYQIYASISLNSKFKKTAYIKQKNTIKNLLKNIWKLIKET